MSQNFCLATIAKSFRTILLPKTKKVDIFKNLLKIKDKLTRSQIITGTKVKKKKVRMKGKNKSCF